MLRFDFEYNFGPQKKKKKKIARGQEGIASTAREHF